VSFLMTQIELFFLDLSWGMYVNAQYKDNTIFSELMKLTCIFFLK
jgi:hypothetical protein